MSYLLEALGRGLLAHLWGAFPGTLEVGEDETPESLAESAAASPDDDATAIRWGAALLRDDRIVEARTVFAKVLDRHPEQLGGLLGLSCAYDELGRHEDAITLLNEARRHDGQNAAIVFCLGYCHERCGRVRESETLYREALALCPGLRNAHERLAAIALRERRLADAIGHYSQLCEWEPELTDLHLTLANLLLESGQPDKAIERYEHALALEPDNWSAQDDVVTQYEKSGMYAEAIEHLQAMIEREPNFADTYVRLGDMFAASGNDAAAMQNYMRGIEIHPEYLEATVRVGTQHLRGGRFEDAARWFTLAVEINDRLLTAYVGLGVAQEAGGKTDESRATMEMAASIEPNSTLLFSEMARMQLRSAVGRQAEESSEFGEDEIVPVVDGDEACDDEQSDPVGEQLLDEQIERHRAALSAGPNHADLHYRLGLMLKHRGNKAEALAEFEKALAVNPGYVKALIKMGLGLLEQGDDLRGFEYLRKAVTLEPGYVDLHYQLGLAFAKRQQFEMAVEHFEHAVAGNPNNAEFQANLALALQQIGLIDRASACWESVRALTRRGKGTARFRLEDRFGELPRLEAQGDWEGE